jgi:hypothetical protein
MFRVQLSWTLCCATWRWRWRYGDRSGSPHPVTRIPYQKTSVRSGYWIYQVFKTRKVSQFCPHNVLMYFVWISEQTAIISLYSINWLVFITETECVYCAARAEYLNIIEVSIACPIGKLWLRRLFAGVSPWKSAFNSRPVHMTFLGGQSGTRTCFFRRVFFGFSPVSIISAILHSHVFCTLLLTSEWNWISKK